MLIPFKRLGVFNAPINILYEIVADIPPKLDARELICGRLWYFFTFSFFYISSEGIEVCLWHDHSLTAQVYLTIIVKSFHSTTRDEARVKPPNGLRFSCAAVIDRDDSRAEAKFQKSHNLARR